MANGQRSESPTGVPAVRVGSLSTNERLVLVEERQRTMRDSIASMQTEVKEKLVVFGNKLEKATDDLCERVGSLEDKLTREESSLKRKSIDSKWWLALIAIVPSVLMFILQLLRK